MRWQAPRKFASTTIAERALWAITGATVAGIPLLAISGLEGFSLPKEIALRAAGLLLMTTTALGILWSTWRPNLHLRNRPVLITVAVVGWTLFAATLSTNRVLSAFAFIYVSVLAAFYLTAHLMLRNRPLSTTVWLLLTPALINATLASVQELNIWNPFTFQSGSIRWDPFIVETGYAHHHRSTALIGNVNEVGAYLIVPTLVAIVTSVVEPTTRRAVLPAASILLIALVLNHTLTALVAFAAGTMTLVLLASPPRRRVIAVAAVVAAIIAAFVLLPPLRQRVGMISKSVQERRYDYIVSGRLPAYAAALEMVARHPWAGVGPGCFGFHYYFSRLRMEQRFSFLRTPMMGMQHFTKAHNDHLQIAAEAGVPAYLLFLAGLAHLASATVHHRRQVLTADVRARFAQLLALPLAVSLFVLMLAQFPLQSAAPTVTILFGAAMCTAWSQQDDQSD